MSVLIELTENIEALKILHNLYSVKSKEHLLAYSTLKNYINWLTVQPKLEYVHIYVFGNWRLTGLYLIVDRYQLMLNSLIANDKNLNSALKLLNWSRGYKIYALPETQLDVVLQTLQELKATQRLAKLFVFKLPHEIALNWQIVQPAKLYFGNLKPQDANFVNNLWSAKQPGSEHFIKRCITLNPSVALYEQQTQRLIAWCTRCPIGFLGSLYVIDEYRRQGLATLIINYFAHRIACAGDEVTVSMYSQNESSLKLFKKLNFIHFDTIYHIRAFTVPENFVWLEN